MADRVARPVGMADRPIEQADAVVALEIGGVGQHQIGIGNRLGIIGVGIDDEGDLVVCPSRRLSVSIAMVLVVFIDEFHAMFAMYMNSVSIL